EGQLISRRRRLRAMDVFDQAARQRLSHAAPQLAAGLEDRPADSLVSFVQDLFELPHHVLAAGDAFVRLFLYYLLHRLEQELLGQYDVRSIARAQVAIRAGAHGGKALVGGDGPGVGRPSARLLPKLLKQRRSGRRLESEIVDALPVPRDDTPG